MEPEPTPEQPEPQPWVTLLPVSQESLLQDLKPGSQSPRMNPDEAKQKRL